MNQTIEIEVTNSVTTKKEIALPCYRKTYAHYYKVLNEKRCLSVCPHAVAYESISMVHNGLAFGQDSEPCTREEFETAYKTANDIINGIAFATE